MLWTKPLQKIWGLFGVHVGAGYAPRIYQGPRKLEPGYGGDLSQSALYKWFQRESTLATSRLGKYREYMSMDDGDIIASALDLYAEDASQVDSSSGRTIWVVSQNSDIEKIANETLETAEAEERAFSWARNLAKFGDHFEALLSERNAQGFPTGVVGMKVVSPLEVRREEDDLGRLAGFLLAPAADTETDMAALPSQDIEISQPWDFIHFRLLYRSSVDDKYGVAMIDPARRVYRYLRMMEESLAIYRLRRAPDRLLWKVFVGDATPEEASEIVTMYRQQIRKKMMTDPATGNIKSELNPMAMDEDIYIPISDEINSDVGVLKGTGDVGDVLDLEYMRKRLFSCLRIPPDYMGFADASGSLTARSPLSDQDVRFARSIKRLQRAIMVGVTLMLKIDMVFKGIDVNRPENEFKVRMHPCSFLDEMQQAETAKVRADIVGQLLQLGQQLDVDPNKWVDYVAKSSGFPEELLKSVMPRVRDERSTAGIIKLLTDAQQTHIIEGTEGYRANQISSQGYRLPFTMKRQAVDLQEVITRFDAWKPTIQKVLEDKRLPSEDEPEKDVI